MILPLWCILYHIGLHCLCSIEAVGDIEHRQTLDLSLTHDAFIFTTRA